MLDHLRGELDKLARAEGLARTRMARELSDVALAALAAAGDEGVWWATRSRSRADVAADLGVSLAAVSKAIRRHNARQKALTERTDTGKLKRAVRAKRT